MLATVRALLRVHAAEEAARAASHQWRLTFDAISDPVCLVDAAGVVLRCNRAVCDLLDRPFPAVVGRPYALLMQEAFQPRRTAPDLAFGAGEPGRQRQRGPPGRPLVRRHGRPDPRRSAPRPAASRSSPT